MSVRVGLLLMRVGLLLVRMGLLLVMLLELWLPERWLLERWLVRLWLQLSPLRRRLRPPPGCAGVHRRRRGGVGVGQTPHRLGKT